MITSDNELAHEGREKHIQQEPLADGTDALPDTLGAVSRRSVVLHFYLITSLSSISFLNSFGLGITTIALPQVVKDLDIPVGLALWPGTANTLAIACCLLPAGAVADIIGTRRVSLTGSLLLTAFTVACGITHDSTSFIVFRALAGVGTALVQSTSVSILSHNITKGRLQNVGFSCLGLSIPFGFAAGLLLGGFFAETSVGWRLGFYLGGGLLGLLLLTNIFTLPNDNQQSATLWRRVLLDIDWIGAFMVIFAFALLSYSFSYVPVQHRHETQQLIDNSLLNTDLENIRKPPAIATLCLGAILLPIFAIWSLSQSARGRVVLLPPQVIKNPEFIFLCCIVFCAWAVLNSMEWFFSI